MSAGLQFILMAAVAAAPADCSWAHPGANPYRGNPTHALADFGLPVGTREKLRAAMAAHRATDIVTITRDDIVGAHGYADLREMHSGGGRTCHGAVDRSAWSTARRERGLVYCADDACLIVPTICNNVSLVTRRPEREAALDDGPIDFAPAAGPAPPADTPTMSATDAMPPGDFLPPPGTGGDLAGTPGPGGTPLGGSPIVAAPGEGLPTGGGLLCCGTTPIGPIGPVEPGVPLVSPTSPVPELPTPLALLAGLAALCVLGRRASGATTGKPARPPRSRWASCRWWATATAG
jgi:hypothetical protein